ncbi:MAG: hypothetical protein WDM84_07620 [Bauldia sp.]
MGQATERGRKLDESKPGSGLGLSIVSDLVGLYQGTLRLSRSPLGGPQGGDRAAGGVRDSICRIDRRNSFKPFLGIHRVIAYSMI